MINLKQVQACHWGVSTFDLKPKLRQKIEIIHLSIRLVSSFQFGIIANKCYAENRLILIIWLVIIILVIKQYSA